MKPITLFAHAIVLLGVSVSSGQDKESQHQAPVAEIRQAAVAFLQSLRPELREQAMFAMDDKERRAWSNLPATSFKREGVSFKEMSSEQRSFAHQLLQSTLSSQGYLKTTGIMHVDELLKSMAEERRPNRTPMFGHDLYWIGIFGDPEKDDSWGWQLDGHHLALNITVVGDEVSVRPQFMGSDPARLPEGTYAGWKVQGAEDEKGKQFYALLDEDQRAKATIAEVAPRDVITGPTRGDQLKQPTGLPASELNDTQRRMLVSLIEEYAHNYEHDIAHIQMERILESGLDKIHFAWAGTSEGKPYYYRIHGPTVIIEFDNHFPPGRSSGPVNHIHTVFREPGNDYGEDLLRKHLMESPHHQDHQHDHEHEHEHE
ncbi:DUF3500 domain-containing protein [Allorhodopirellula solitaria]|uniref:DUF3500 domain-containing protein n=1 Tax=Allorhodopirellula solitaria TaxID=2527987 RepID=A0A5C5YJS0_9BACT|nr:DUF3500 domain-containing protein [Allorhodopirellula solitaria]TWT75130.1 hypothetical protein CA85_04190 [Allorhodopirellula solitaria]